MRSPLPPLPNPTWPLPFFSFCFPENMIANDRTWGGVCLLFLLSHHFLRMSIYVLLFFLFFWKTFSHMKANERYDFRIILIFSFLYSYNPILYSCILILIFLYSHCKQIFCFFCNYRWNKEKKSMFSRMLLWAFFFFFRMQGLQIENCTIHSPRIIYSLLRVIWKVGCEKSNWKRTWKFWNKASTLNELLKKATAILGTF